MPRTVVNEGESRLSEPEHEKAPDDVDSLDGEALSDASAPRSAEYESLVLEHVDMLYAVALSLTRNPTEAEDLMQNTLVKALRFHDKFREGTYIKAWLLTILRNTFINEYRRRARRPAFVELTGAEPAPDTTAEREPTGNAPEGPSTEELLELLDDNVRRALDALPNDFRMAVIMADLEERSYKDIADTMGCPIGTVMSRLFRGRRLLREQLESYAREQRVVIDQKKTRGRKSSRAKEVESEGAVADDEA